MALYRYVKRQPAQKKSFPAAGRLNRRVIPGLLVILGLFLLGNAVYPIVSYQLLVSPRFTNTFVSPTTEAAIAQTFGTPANNESAILGSEIDLVDLTKASNWLPAESHQLLSKEEEEIAYYLSIPKLGIKNALVTMGDDLKKSLIQYPGTAAPGRFGNTVVFGHSVLPQFFNPKNYVSIFSTLPTLNAGDEVIIDYNQVRYKYKVEQMIEVAPDDISILAQRYDDSYLTLITCVPPGTYLRRLIIRTRLTKL